MIKSSDFHLNETVRTALQGLLAATTAAAQGQNATTAAMGASASVVLNNLLEATNGDSSNSFSLEQREARKNLVTILIAGTTHALGGDAALANSAATIEAENKAVAVPLPPPPIIGYDNDITHQANKTLALALQRKVKAVGKALDEAIQCSFNRLIQFLKTNQFY